MKRIAVLISLFILLAFICNANSSYIDKYISENYDELNDVLSAVIDYGGSGLPYDKTEIEINDLVRIYKFTDTHLPNYFSEHGNISDNIYDTQEYKHFSSTGFTHYIGKNEEMKWEVHTESNELKVASKNHPEISFEFKDMMDNIASEYPDYDYESVKYIEYFDLGTILVYFASNNTEYLACYPTGNIEDGINLTCGAIYTVKEYLDIIEDYPIFDQTEKSVGIGGGVGIKNDTTSIPWFIYPIIGVEIVGVVVVIYKLTKRKAKM